MEDRSLQNDRELTSCRWRYQKRLLSVRHFGQTIDAMEDPALDCAIGGPRQKFESLSRLQSLAKLL